MKSVPITSLEANLNEYLQDVRRGNPITILDGDTPIARIVPIETQADELTSRKPTSQVSFWEVPLPEPYQGGTDVVDLLLEERRVDR